MDARPHPKAARLSWDLRRIQSVLQQRLDTGHEDSGPTGAPGGQGGDPRRRLVANQLTALIGKGRAPLKDCHGLWGPVPGLQLLGDPEAVAVLEPRTALAYERSELVRDETAARGAALAAWRSGRARVLVASVQALLQHTLDPAEIPAQPRRLRVGTRVHQDELLRELLALGYDPVTEVAGRGEFARRGGLVDVFPSAASLPIRIEMFGDEIDSMRVFDPTDQRSLRPIEEVALLPASEFLVPSGGPADVRARVARMPGRGAPAVRQRLGRASPVSHQ